jgi:phosphate uptake regulator
MKRSIVKQGAATMMISLPSKWIKKHNLSKGDELEIEERDGSITLSLEPSKHKRETTINITTSIESIIRTTITNAYRLGYDKISINFKDKEAPKIIKDIVERNLPGFEIIKRTDTHCEIESVTEPSNEQFDNIFSKMLMNIDELFAIAEDALNGKKREFEDTERNIMKYDNFCRRVLHKTKNFDVSMLIWTFHTEIIHAQREIYYLIKYLSENKTKSDKKAQEFLALCKEIYNMLKIVYEKKDIVQVEKVHEKNKELNKQFKELMKKTDNPILIHYIFNAGRKFYLSSSRFVAVLLS